MTTVSCRVLQGTMGINAFGEMFAQSYSLPILLKSLPFGKQNLQE